MEERAVLVSCWSCGTPFGRLGEPGQAQLIDAHYRDCTDYLNGEGLKKERPLAYAFEDANA